MTELSNPFNLLDEDTPGSNEPEIEDFTAPSTNTQLSQSWADISEDSDDPLDEFGRDDLPKNTNNTSQPHILPKNNEVLQSIKEADLEWSKKIIIEVKHDVRLYNKETDKLIIEQNTRRLTVIQKRDYDKLKSLIETTRSHRGPNREFMDKEKQRDKIKLANTLLEKCYKDPRTPCTFVYPVARIHARDSKGQTRILTRNEIFKASNCYFEIGDIICDMNNLSKDSENNAPVNQSK
jgi:hypothetical protein